MAVNSLDAAVFLFLLSLLAEEPHSVLLGELCLQFDAFFFVSWRTFFLPTLNFSLQYKPSRSVEMRESIDGVSISRCPGQKYRAVAP